MSKTNLLLVFGGESAEHEVSIRSARNIFDAINKETYDIDLCYIDRNGVWWHATEVTDDQPCNDRLTPLLGNAAFIDERGKRIEPDVIFPVLHGPNGEDGTVQGLAQLAHIPIVGCGVLGSAICMDKDVTKRLLSQANIPVTPGMVHYLGDGVLSYEKLVDRLGGKALFVKPANLGSSVGVSKVIDDAGMTRALEEAHKHDHKVLIECAINGRELECAVLGNDQPEASVVGEIMPGDDFYSYDEKYATDSKTKTSADVTLPDGVSDKIRQTAIAAYKALECRGLSRVDFFLADDGTIYVNEVNTLPGFTSISMYPQLWGASGVSYSQLIDRLVRLALE